MGAAVFFLLIKISLRKSNVLRNSCFFACANKSQNGYFLFGKRKPQTTNLLKQILTWIRWFGLAKQENAAIISECERNAKSKRKRKSWANFGRVWAIFEKRNESKLGQIEANKPNHKCICPVALESKNFKIAFESLERGQRWPKV